MTRVRTLGMALALLTASLAFAPAPAAVAHETRVAEDPILTIVGVATQLGLKVQARDGEEFALGTSFTGLLAEPQKLARFGMQMHDGARVTAARMAPDKIRVEADEMEPVAARASATLKVDVKGELSAIPKP
jgi:hypothetical protein